MEAQRKTATLLISCPDQKGIVATVADFLYRFNGNILDSDQHQDREQSLFLMRTEWDLEGFELSLEEFNGAFSPIARKLGMAWRVALSEVRPRVAIFTSKYDHCMADLLHRHRGGEYRCEIPLVIGNHEETGQLARFHGYEFHHLPVTPANKAEVEKRQLELLKDHRIDLIVLARYMQILGKDFVDAYPGKIINIHHSFLPAFLGAKPYHRAFERGVKLIGATSHYVTETLDDGPIIDQDVIRVTDRDTVESLVQKGRDVERIVLSRAVRWHLENRILVYGNKTVVFA